MTKDIYIKDYDANSFGVKLETYEEADRVFEGKAYMVNTDLITELSVNDYNVEATPESIALANALEKLIENHSAELLELYEKKLKENADDY